MENTGKELTASATNIGLTVATFLLNTGFVLQAILLCEECLILLKRLEMHKKEHNVTEAQENYSLREFDWCKDCMERALAIRVEIGDRDGEATKFNTKLHLNHVITSLYTDQTSQWDVTQKLEKIDSQKLDLDKLKSVLAGPSLTYVPTYTPSLNI